MNRLSRFLIRLEAFVFLLVFGVLTALAFLVIAIENLFTKKPKLKGCCACGGTGIDTSTRTGFCVYCAGQG